MRIGKKTDTSLRCQAFLPNYPLPWPTIRQQQQLQQQKPRLLQRLQRQQKQPQQQQLQQLKQRQSLDQVRNKFRQLFLNVGNVGVVLKLRRERGHVVGGQSDDSQSAVQFQALILPL